jgi:hypothetical protein
MLGSNQSLEFIRSFAEQYFDAAFNEKVLDLLIERYRGIEEHYQDLITCLFNSLVDSAIKELDDRESRQELPDT